MIEHPVSAFHTGASHPYPRKLLDVTLSYGAFEHYLECYLPLLVVCKVRDNSDHVLISFRYDGRRFDADNHPRPGTLRSWLLASACSTCASFIHPGCGGLIGAVDCAKLGAYRWVAAAAKRYP
jgi:hypothetical protein